MARFWGSVPHVPPWLHRRRHALRAVQPQRLNAQILPPLVPRWERGRRDGVVSARRLPQAQHPPGGIDQQDVFKPMPLFLAADAPPTDPATSPSAGGCCHASEAHTCSRSPPCLTVIDTVRDRLLCLCMRHGDLRVSEVSHVTWEDIDVHAKTIRIHDSQGHEVPMVAPAPVASDQAVVCCDRSARPGHCRQVQPDRMGGVGSTRTGGWQRRAFTGETPPAGRCSRPPASACGRLPRRWCPGDWPKLS